MLDLENENFQVDTYRQRLDVIAEMCAFLLQVTDRLIYSQFTDKDRATFIRTLGIHLMETMQDNRVDAQGDGNYRDAFVQILNERADDYADCGFEDGMPSFTFRRNFGNNIMNVVGEADKRWVPDYIMDIRAPAMVKTHKTVMGRILRELEL